MKKRIIFLVILALLLGVLPGTPVFKNQAEGAAPMFERVNYAHGVVTAYYLNMRQGPSTDYYIIRVLKKGQAVKVIGKMGSWYAVIDVKSGCFGCVHGKYIKVSTSAELTAEEEKENEQEEKDNEKETAAQDLVSLSESESSFLEMVNRAREEEGLSPLKVNSQLMRVARLKVQDMLDNGYFSHTSARFGSPWDMMRKYNVSFKCAAENIAGNKTLQGAFDAWMEDDNHKGNLLNPKFSHTGIGVVESPAYGKLIVQQMIGE